MNPDEGPEATAASDIPLAALLDGVVTCPHCGGWIEPSAAYSGQTVACPHCNGHFQLPETIELGFVPPPAPLGITPPKEPWFYGFIDTYATVWMWLALLVTAPEHLSPPPLSFSLRNRRLPRRGRMPAWIKAILPRCDRRFVFALGADRCPPVGLRSCSGPGHRPEPACDPPAGGPLSIKTQLPCKSVFGPWAEERWLLWPSSPGRAAREKS